MPESSKVVIVEDDSVVAAHVAQGIDAHPALLLAHRVASIAAARAVIAPDIALFIIDLGLPDGSGIDLIGEIRAAGAKIRLISDGDVAGAIAAAGEYSSVDMLLGIGGTPEGIITAAALKCMGGEIQGRLWPKDDAEREKALAAGHDLDKVLTTAELVRGENVFFCATGITDGPLLRGVHYRGGGATTQSIVMRSKSGTVRLIDGYHRLTKLREFSSVDFDGVEGEAPPLP